MASRVLIVEDEQHLAEGVRFNLEAEGYEADVVETGEAALERLLGRAQRYDLVVLDVMLPGEDGLAICRRLSRPDGPAIIMLSAMGEETDRIVGLELGALCPELILIGCGDALLAGPVLLRHASRSDSSKRRSWWCSLCASLSRLATR